MNYFGLFLDLYACVITCLENVHRRLSCVNSYMSLKHSCHDKLGYNILFTEHFTLEIFD